MSLNRQSKNITIILSVVISFLFVAVITYSATTISTNINTGGTLTVSGNATSTFGTGGLTVGTSQFVVQQTSGNVGIGTTSPHASLTVSNDFFIAANSNTWSSNTRKGLYIRYSDWLTQDSAYIQSIDRATNTPYPMWFEASSYYFKESGNVGIGTTTPSNLLSVYSATAATQGFSGGATKGVWSMGYDVTNNRFAIASSSNITSNVRMVINNDGNVGIGTTTPNRLLNIAGNAGPQLLLTQPGAGTDLKHWYASTTNGSLTFGTLNDSLSTLTERLRVDNLGRLGIGTTTPTASLQVATSTANATTTMEVGKANQTKGTCLKLYDDVGVVYYCRITGGTFTCNTTSCE